MKITGVRAFHSQLKTGLTTIGANPVRIDVTPVVTVQIQTDEGIEGVCADIYITSGKVLADFIEEVLAPVLLGKDPFMIGQLDEEMAIATYRNRMGTSLMRANGVVNVALWDVVGKALKKPVAHLLGAYQNKVKAYASTAEWKEPSELANDARKFADDGFLAMKVRAGRPNKLDDIRVVAAIRDAIGDRMELWIDANRSYSRTRALWQAHAFAEYGIRSIEEPLNPEDIEGYAELCAKSPVPISAGENLLTLLQWRNALQRNALDIMQPWPTQCGGISGLYKLCGLAEAFNREIEPHASLSLAESLHVMCTTPKVSYIMWSIAQEKVRDAVFDEYIKPVNGYLHLPEKPGLGITIKPELMQ